MASVLPVMFTAIGGGALVVLMLSAARKQSQRAHANVEKLAAQLGLTVAPATKRFGFWSKPRASGRFREKQAELFTYTTGSGKSRVRWTALAVKPRDSGGFTFCLARQGLGTRISELFGAREITVGDPAFDAAWFIQTNQPEFFQAALIPELRARLTAVFEKTGRTYRSGSFKLEKDAVVYSEVGDFGDEERCRRIARISEVLSDFADAADVFAESKNA